MLRRATPDFRRLGLVSALIAAIPGAALAQDRPERVLPPPSLLDAAPPPGARPVDVMPVQRAQSVGTAVSSQPAAPASPAKASAAAPVAATAAASRPASDAPAAEVTSGAMQEGDPWYRRWWHSMFGGTSSQPREATQVAVAPSSSSAAPPVTLPTMRSQTAPSGRAGYAQDTPDRTVRTGMMGECVKTGTWEPSDMMSGCGTGPQVAKVEERAAAPAPVRDARVEPVEVKPLATPALKEEKSLDVEPSTAAAPPQPEPAAAPVAAAPPPAKPQLTTLSADALFAVGSAQLKPGAKASLDDFAAKLKSMDFQTIKVVGHTDPTGKAKMNDKLSKQRAEAVKRYLVAKGVPASRIQAEGVGSAMPMVVDNDCARLAKAQRAACYQPDRRVEIEVQGATSRVAQQ
jgi:outer membrane protein OmpA-like peptidoglycan-associated protein